MCTPSRCAISHTFFGPTSRVSWAYTVLSEESVARVTDTLPRYVLPYVCTCHGSFGEHHGLTVHVNGAET